MRLFARVVLQLIACLLLTLFPNRLVEALDSPPRFTVTYGTALFLSDGVWESALRAGGFGDWLRHSRLSSTPDRRDRYPQEGHDGELYYVDMKYRMRRWLAIAVSVNMNEPFSNWTGFKETGEGFYGGSDGRFLILDPTVLSFSSLLIVQSGPGPGPIVSAGAGPGVHRAAYRAHVDTGEWIQNKATKLGFTAQVALQYPLRRLVLGFDLRYNWVGLLKMGPQTVGDPDFPRMTVSFNYAYFGTSLGVRLW